MIKVLIESNIGGEFEPLIAWVSVKWMDRRGNAHEVFLQRDIIVYKRREPNAIGVWMESNEIVPYFLSDAEAMA